MQMAAAAGTEFAVSGSTLQATLVAHCVAISITQNRYEVIVAIVNNNNIIIFSHRNHKVWEVNAVAIWIQLRDVFGLDYSASVKQTFVHLPSLEKMDNFRGQRVAYLMSTRGLRNLTPYILFTYLVITSSSHGMKPIRRYTKFSAPILGLVMLDIYQGTGELFMCRESRGHLKPQFFPVISLS